MDLKQAIERYASLALEGVERPFPYHLSTVYRAPLAVATPSEVHPAFYGCFDWHSAVHGHWLIALATQVCHGSAFSEACLLSLLRTLTEQSLADEASFLESNPSFERPYGLAWVLMLDVQFRRSSDPRLESLAPHVASLASVAFDNLRSWLPKLTHPVRTGTHNQSAFALKLAFDWAIHSDVVDARELIESTARRFFLGDRSLPIHLEPSGEDFLSPALSEVWLMAAILDDDEFAVWYRRVLGDAAPLSDLRPLVPLDRKDGRLVHLDGLNLSRSWMLGALAEKIGSDHEDFNGLRGTCVTHAQAGLRSALSVDYMASHWLGTFAAYLLRELDGFLGCEEILPESDFKLGEGAARSDEI